MKKWFQQKDALDSTAALLKTLIYHLHIPVSIGSIEQMATSHREYPHHGTISLQQILQAFGIQTLSTNARLSDIPPFSILLLKNSNQVKLISRYALFYKIDDDNIEYLHPEEGWVTEELETFEEKWAKTTLAITAFGMQTYNRTF